MTTATAGSTVRLLLNFYDETNGTLTDPASVTLDITYGTEVTLAPDVAGPYQYFSATSPTAGQVWRIGAGQYAFDWPVPFNTPPGVYVANWTCPYGANTFLGIENFPLLGGTGGGTTPAGDIGYWTGAVIYPAAGLDIEFGQVDSNGIAWLWQKIDGWDGPDVQGAGVIPRAGDHGAWATPQFYAARQLTLTVSASAPTQALRDTARALLQEAIPVSDLATLRYDEPVPKQALVRRAGKITEAYPTLSDVVFTCGLVAPDPRKYGTVVKTAATGSLPSTVTGITLPVDVPFSLIAQSPGGTVMVTNAGNFETRPVITIAGPVTSPGITNITTGQTVSWTSLVLGSGDRLVVDFNSRQALLNGSYRAADLLSSWFTMPPGASTLQFAGSNDTGATMSAQWQDAFI